MGGERNLFAIKQVAKGNSAKKKSDLESARKEVFFGSFLFRTGGEPKFSSTLYPGINNIAKLFHYFETRYDLWLVMEFGGVALTKLAYDIKGEFLQGERLYRVTHLPLLQAMKKDTTSLKVILRQLISALRLLADQHIVHSDIKPDNILVEERELHCRFIDFGNAFTFDCPESLTMTTPEYMPPEALEACAARSCQSTGRLSVGQRGTNGCKADPRLKLSRTSRTWSFDVWSVGSIFLELCLGIPLWLSYKCRVADDDHGHRAATGLFAVPGRDPQRVRQRQSETLHQRGLARVLHDSAGVFLNNDIADGEQGVKLLAAMLAWEPLDRISPEEALAQPWLSGGEA